MFNQICYKKIVFVILLFVFIDRDVLLCNELEQQITIKYTETKNILLNPNMGFYVAGWNHSSENDLPIYSNLLYHRFMWKDLEPEKGDFRLEKIKKFIFYWKEKNCRVAFRIINSNIRGTQTPEYVFNEGIPGVLHKTRNGFQKDPVYWNPQYLQLYSDFIQKLGKNLNQGEGIEFIDIGGIGVYGEMHLGLHISGMWTKSELIIYDFSEENYFAAYKRIIEAYQKAFSKTRLFLNISRYDKIAEYAAKLGIGLRFDGLTYKHYSTHDMVSNIFRRFASNKSNNMFGVPTMYEFAFKETKAEIIEKCLQKAFLDPISYIHINLGKTSLLKNNVHEILKTYAKNIGYRFYLKSITIPEILSKERKFSVNQIWINKGSANAYQNFNFRFSIFQGNKKIFSQDIKPAISTSSWQPGEIIEMTSDLDLFSKIDDGIFDLTLCIAEKKTGKIIQIANERYFIDGSMKLFNFKVKNGNMNILSNGTLK